MDVAAWLRGLGLERYEPAFRDNEIDWEALPKLTAEDLKDLGVVLGSHRRKLLEAIAALHNKTDADHGLSQGPHRDHPGLLYGVLQRQARIGDPVFGRAGRGCRRRMAPLLLAPS